MTNEESRTSRGRAHVVVAGAGQIGSPLVTLLARAGHRVTWMSRTRPAAVPDGVTHVAVDVTDAARVAEVARGAHALIAAVNPATYDATVWARTLPPMHRGLIDGAAMAGTRLVVLDALYLYALDRGPLSPSTPQSPTTKKGAIRKQIADMLVDAQRAGRVRATTLRAPDFWGPGLSSALFTREGIEGMRRGRRPLLIGDPDVVHAFAHRDDVVDALVALAFATDDVEGEVFHAPVIHVTPRAMASAIAGALGVSVRPFVAPRALLVLAGIFSASTRGLVEMLPQWRAPYRVDDSGYRARFGVTPTSLEAGAADIARAHGIGASMPRLARLT